MFFSSFSNHFSLIFYGYPLRPIAATYLTKLFNTITIHNSPAATAREVSKPPTASASLLVSTEKNFQFWIWGSLGGTSKVGVVFAFYGLLYPALGANPMSQFLGSSVYGN